jgi:hypothetical protein
MDAAISCAARGVGDNQRNNESREPDRDGKEKSFDMSIAECIDDGGEEVLERLRKK